MGTETEITFAARGADPGAVLARLARVERIGETTLTARPTVAIHDAYFDTPDRALARVRGALRLRHHGDDRLLALKGEGEAGADGLSRRPELERRLHPSVPLDDLREAIADLAPSPAPTPEQLRATPRESLLAAGFEIIQQRAMERQRRSVARAPLGEVAELCLDTVVYELGAHGWRHREVELEARPGTPEEVLRELGAALRALAPEELHPWAPSKLVTGFALEALAEEDALPPHPGGVQDIAPALYDAIARRVATLG